MEEEKIEKKANLTVEEKYQKGLEFKQQGNESFKIKDWKKSLTNYHKALLHITGFQSPDSEYYKYANEQQKASKELAEKIKQLQHDLYSNMGQIYIYQQKYSKAVEFLNKAIQVKENGGTVKVLYRKAIAKMELQDLDEAKELFNQVLLKDASQKKEIEKNFVKIELMQKKIDKEAGSTYKKMFS